VKYRLANRTFAIIVQTFRWWGPLL